MNSSLRASAAQVDSFLDRWKLWIAVAACLFAAARILVFAAAFPLFNPLDESYHYELVHEYSRWYLSGPTLMKSDPEIARIIATYYSSEYYWTPDVLHRNFRDIPLSKLPQEKRDDLYPKLYEFWHKQYNVESQSPPFYYFVAAAWYRAGEFIGLHEWKLAYWVRFLNALLYAIFVWVSYRFVAEVFPENSFLCAGVPVLLAAIPQDVFYGANRDVLLPLFFAVFLLFLSRALRKQDGGERELIYAGLVAGVSFVTEVSSFLLFFVLFVAVLARARRAEKRPDAKRSQVLLGCSLLAASALPLLWMIRNRIVIGDLTASQEKTFALGWAAKSFREIWPHPLFTAKGAWYFFSQLTATFWRGEIFWNGGPFRSIRADHFYVFSSLLLFAVFVFFFFRNFQAQEKLQRTLGVVSLFLIVSSVAFLAILSLLYDYQQCVYPSRDLPYFVSGRIICGVLLPFAIVYVAGLEFLLKPVRRWIHPFAVLLLICAAVTWSEVLLSLPVFRSSFNFFSLMGM